MYKDEDAKGFASVIEDVNYTKEIQAEISDIYKASSVIKNRLREKVTNILES